MTSKPNLERRLALAVLVAFAMACPAVAQTDGPKLTELDEVGLTEHLDAELPLDLEFREYDGSAEGRKVALREFFDGTRPVILTMNYSNCPKLCSVQLNALVDAMKKMDWNLGEEYQVLTVGIDPLETPERAQLTKQKYLKNYGRPGTAEGWHFVTSRDESKIKQVADTVGFGYSFNPDRNEYNHVAVLMLCTPEGRVSRYLGGVRYDPQTLRLSLAEAADGKVGSAMDQVLLYCFHYDAAKGRYAPAAFRFMQLGALLTLIVLGGVLLKFWRKERGKAKLGSAASTT